MCIIINVFSFRLKTTFFVILFLGHFSSSKAQSLQIRSLSVDHLLLTNLEVVNGYSVFGQRDDASAMTFIANKNPMLGWELIGSGHSSGQSAYHILVSDNLDSASRGIGNIWDSGKVLSEESSNVLYKGKALNVSTRYYWRVKVWDIEDEPSAWSLITEFYTGEQLNEYQTSVYPLVKTDERPAELSTVENITRVDFGKAAFGQLRFTLNATETGLVNVRMGEAINVDGAINRKPGGTIRYAEYQVKLKSGRYSYQLQFRPDRRNTGPQAIKMPDYIGEVFPFRYVEIEGYKDNLEKSDIVRAAVHYPFDDFASHFESSDSILNAVWDLCKYSIKATSFAGIYVDGDRERIPYEADAYINQLCHYNVDREYSMGRRSHEYLLHNATWPTEWILQSVIMAYNDYLYTGDIRSVNHHYEDLKAKLLIPLRDRNGLLSTKTGKQTQDLMRSIYYKGDSIRDIVDWPHTGSFGMVGNGEIDGFVFTTYNAVVNAFHFKALMDMVKLATVTGRTSDAVFFSKKAEETYNAFQSLLWNKHERVYTDGVETSHASLHTNMMALAFGLVPDKHKSDVMNFIRSRGMACSVYGSQFLMDAVYDAEDEAYGLSLLTSQADRSWYNMIRSGSTITMEAWGNQFKPNQDWNHAWGAVPANVIPRKLMGVEPIHPGWKVFRVKPQLGSLEWAKIKVPTIKGAIEVSCVQSAANYKMELTVPVNSTAIVELPAEQSRNGKLRLNGKMIKAKRKKNGGYILPALNGGMYTIEITI